MLYIYLFKSTYIYIYVSIYSTQTHVNTSNNNVTLFDIELLIQNKNDRSTYIPSFACLISNGENENKIQGKGQ